MSDIIRLEKVADYNYLLGVETPHPLVSVVDLSKINRRDVKHTHLHYGFYTIYLKESLCGELVYGRNSYDYEEGTLLFISPGQVVKINRNAQLSQQKGWALMFHPDLIHGTPLGRNIGDYNFFSYEINEALHVSEREREILYECFSKIAYEIEQRLDKHSKRLIVNNIQLLLDYCMRFYDRQFLTRENVNRGTIEQFEKVLNDYFKSGKPQSTGLPSVAYIADQLNLSANYFGDLVKKETGKTAQEYIHLKIITLAKDQIFDASRSISEIAYDLGFKYPQHFTRMFKKSTGVSPNEFRLMN
ncbi:MAG TPA: helix-turn-helix domain-containing protein [Prolixibacteraceae bacterium]|nr:helix-turn-helix domain-containing protein [Prolixibacteraceae bacterium]